MKIPALFLLFIFISNSSIGQTKTEKDYSDQYYNENWSAGTYVNLIDTLIKYFNFKLVKNFKNQPIREFKAALLNLGADAIKQMNIDGWYFCSKKHEDCYQLWNLYYPKIARESWDKLCKGLIPLMSLDGVLITH